MIDSRSSVFLLSAMLINSQFALTAFGESQHRQPLQSQGQEQSSEGRQRLRPPDRVTCPRNNLTSFSGRVLSFYRSTGRTILRMRTDEATTERFTLKHPKSDDPSKWFLLRGEPFKQSDWALIESARNRLQPNMRAIVWVCDDGTNPIVDWRPPEGGKTPVSRHPIAKFDR